LAFSFHCCWLVVLVSKTREDQLCLTPTNKQSQTRRLRQRNGRRGVMDTQVQNNAMTAMEWPEYWDSAAL
jgi:hypothetical protein